MASGLVGGRYEIIQKIAEGGMGAVYEARHHMTKKSVALKVLFPHIGKDEASKQRFLREVSAPATIGHEGIVEVYDSGFDPNDGSLFVAMELLRGDTLREFLDRGGHSRDTILDLFMEILAPLAAAHERGIVHRDLKPENIFLARQRDHSVRVKILDFGIARDLDTSQQNVTRTGIAMGTPHYMAPEQAMSARGVVASADVWALGAMLYEALSGRPPFDGETPSAIVVHACTQAHPPIRSVVDVPQPLAELVDGCLAKEPLQRPPDAGALARFLQERRPPREAGATVPTLAASLPIGAGQGAPQPGSFGTAGHVTPQPGSFGTAGHVTPQPGSFGAGQAPVSPAGARVHGAIPVAQPAPARGGRIWVVLALGLVVLIAGVGVAFAFWARSQGPGTTATTPSGPGDIQITTDVGGGELFVDGVSQGPVASGHQVVLAEGPHELELRVAGNAVAVARVTPTPSQLTPVDMSRGTFAGGSREVVRGALQTGDRTIQSGELADYLTRTWPAGTKVYLELRSTEFDPYVIAKPPTQRQLDNDDRAQGETDAALAFTVDEGGAWQVIATSFRAGEAGDYELLIATMPP